MEDREYTGGRPFYGDAVGVLMLDMQAPLIPGNVGNAMSYDFPVRYKVMKGLPSDWWCDEIGPDESRCQIFIEAAKELEAEGLSLKIVLAFGFPKETDRNRDREPKRIAMDDLCVYKEQPKAWVKEMLEAARLAPSSTNSQPWRFVVYENRIHVFSKKPLDEMSLLNPFTELNFGIMLANVMVAAEEVWVDLDLIKLNNITHKSIPNNQYVISILLKP